MTTFVCEVYLTVLQKGWSDALCFSQERAQTNTKEKQVKTEEEKTYNTYLFLLIFCKSQTYLLIAWSKQTQEKCMRVVKKIHISHLPKLNSNYELILLA